VFKPEKGRLGSEGPPEGTWQVDGNGNLIFVPKGEERPELRRPETNPEGSWVQDAEGRWNFQLTPGQSISPGRLSRRREFEELPVGDIERTQFFIRRLEYRKGNEIIDALSKIAASLQGCGQINEDLLCAINSGQWIESSNSMIFTGAPSALARVKELIEEVDAPVRQVFIEMLILETTITDSLRFAVNWESSFGGGDTVGGQAFLSPASALTSAFNNTNNLPSNVSNLIRDQGYTMGIIGQSISHCGVTFRTLGALVKAVHNISNSKVLMNPKIIVEDQQEAEIFVGINTSYQTNSIANDRGNTITSNFEYRDIGTTLRITPSIGNNGLVTLDIFQESSNVISSGNGANGGSTGGGGGTNIGGGAGNNNQNNNSGPTTRVNKTITRVHIPNRYFLVISGMMQDDNTLTRVQIPCLGGVPLLGALFSDRDRRDQRQNLMIFIRPEIVDTVDEMQNLTKHQQDIFKKRGRLKQSWKYEAEEALDFLNVPEVCRPWCADPDSPN
jgi:type III secretion protein C